MGNQNIASLNQETVNQIYSNSKATCGVISNQSISNVRIVVGICDNCTISLSQTATVNGSCAMSQAVDTQIDNIIKSSAEQSLSAERTFLSLDFSSLQNSNQVEINNSVTNLVSTLVSSTCTISGNQTIENVDIVVGQGSNVAIGLAQTQNVTGQCSIDNIVKTRVFNELTATSDQDLTVKSSLTIIIIAIVILLVASYVIYYYFRYGGSSTPAPTTAPASVVTPAVQPAAPAPAPSL
ncbi:Hypothetical protein ORPV_31 [Orpheovirus IHUMI-LCC2]|uniref:Lipid membrane protein n=1 Tax=Orpheovirus IHUMI-LCC2 TaxID=2023057 RepID=A0A2I2L314_9VIRU|nr:Hypothetical protein ORPV_31 [Orpheovirus IHUMI-LCC2]SNW61935.1 Hypothetical protein ORPV_31 [Orpheovirus IHUMI-LCC2]